MRSPLERLEVLEQRAAKPLVGIDVPQYAFDRFQLKALEARSSLMFLQFEILCHKNLKSTRPLEKDDSEIKKIRDKIEEVESLLEAMPHEDRRNMPAGTFMTTLQEIHSAAVKVSMTEQAKSDPDSAKLLGVLRGLVGRLQAGLILPKYQVFDATKRDFITDETDLSELKVMAPIVQSFQQRVEALYAQKPLDRDVEGILRDERLEWLLQEFRVDPLFES